MGKKKGKKGRPVEVASPVEVAAPAEAEAPGKLRKKDYEREMKRLHGELVALQEW